MKQKLTLTNFTPAEAEAITGVTVTNQRDWRRHGYLPKNEGHARFDLFSLSRLLFMRSMSARGIGPESSHELADWVSYGISQFALQWVDAWEGDHKKLLINDEIVEHVSRGSKNWEMRQKSLTRLLFRQEKLPPIQPGSMFIWWANGDHIFHNSLHDAMADILSDDPRVTGAIVVLDFASISSVLLDRSERALVHVEWVED